MALGCPSMGKNQVIKANFTRRFDSLPSGVEIVASLVAKLSTKIVLLSGSLNKHIHFEQVDGRESLGRLNYTICKERLAKFT